MSATALLRACPQRNGCPLVRPRDLRRLDLAPRLTVLALAAGLSVLVHLGAMAALAPRGQVLIEGGGEDAPAALGTSFADFAEGTLEPEEAEALPPDRSEAIMPDAVRQTVAPPSQAPLQPAATALALPSASDPESALLPAAPEQADRPDPAELLAMAAPPATAAQAESAPERAAPESVSPESPTPESETLAPDRPETPEAPSPQDVAAATRPDILDPDTSPNELAPDSSRKPPPRPDRTARAEPARPEPTRQTRAPQGNAAQNATRGSQQAVQGQAASEAPARAQATEQGTAAASNYPGEVLRRIQRVRQARSPARGQVLVSFSIGDSGALAAVTVARSSGHSGLDQTALDHIRRAAPFPAPPSGAQRQFSFEFVGR